MYQKLWLCGLLTLHRCSDRTENRPIWNCLATANLQRLQKMVYRSWYWERRDRQIFSRRTMLTSSRGWVCQVLFSPVVVIISSRCIYKLTMLDCKAKKRSNSHMCVVSSNSKVWQGVRRTFLSTISTMVESVEVGFCHLHNNAPTPVPVWMASKRWLFSNEFSLVENCMFHWNLIRLLKMKHSSNMQDITFTIYHMINATKC